jgi:hypothetical protein
MGSGKPEILFRYTSLPVLLHTLQSRQITLLSPETWEDRNDAYYLDQYRQKKNLGSVLAVCFAQGGERFHFWRIFSSGSSGVCLEFDKACLLKCFDGVPGFRHQSVDYPYIQDLEKDKPDIASLPFLKRYAFKDEKEYRIIFENATKNLRETSVPIDLGCIRSIIFSPWLPSKIEKSVMEVVRSIDGCAGLKLRASRLLENARWRAAIK